uniref:Uncharacterized protein n=1 Tax=Knipowitschia caucasica TaxID=637954 RepID=A0AAV2K114_KNICA
MAGQDQLRQALFMEILMEAGDQTDNQYLLPSSIPTSHPSAPHRLGPSPRLLALVSGLETLCCARLGTRRAFHAVGGLPWIVLPGLKGPAAATSGPRARPASGESPAEPHCCDTANRLRFVRRKNHQKSLHRRANTERGIVSSLSFDWRSHIIVVEALCLSG